MNTRVAVQPHTCTKMLFNTYPAGGNSDKPLPPVYSQASLHICAV